MKKHRTGQGSVAGLKGLKAGVSIVALAAIGLTGMGLAGAVCAQDTAQNQTMAGAPAADDAQEVVVVGVRRALKTAQQIKKDADTNVDSITATDIGAFPDKSVAEALQRVPGITVGRLQSSDDSSHFSGEPSQVLIRGLTFVRTEFNGRDSFSADAARGLNFNDISPELMAGVDSYKNATAEMIEGGIAGSVNLRTRVPFDSKGQLISISAKANYGDRSDKTTYEYSGIYSNRWSTDAGEFGFLADYANSHVLTQTEAVHMLRIGTLCTSGFGSASAPTVSADGSIPCAANPYGGTGWLYMPSGVNYSQVVYDRSRHGSALAFQYQNNDHTVLFTAQYNDSYYRNAWLERSANVGLFGLWAAPAFAPQTSAFIAPATGTPALAFGADGMLDSGDLTQPLDDWGFGTQAHIDHGSAVPGKPFVNYCGEEPDHTVTTCATNREGVYLENQARNFNHSEGTKDFSMNLKWDVNDHLKTNFDLQYIEAETSNYDILVANDTLANVGYKTNDDGTPMITLLPGSNVNYAAGGISNPHNYFLHFIQDHYENNDANELALRADAQYAFEDIGWLDSLKVGVRYADREQNVRYTKYNWSPVAANWGCNGPGFNIDNTTPAAYPACHGGTFQGYGAGIWETASLGKFFDGDFYPNGNTVFLSRETLADHDGAIAALNGAKTNSPFLWTPLCNRTDADVVDKCYVPSEMLDVTEKTTAAYFMLKFGGPDKTIFGGVTLQGNVGVRYVQTENTSHGGVSFPSDTAWYTSQFTDVGTGKTYATAADKCAHAPLNGGSVTNIICWLTPDLLAFSNAAGSANDLSKKHEHFLPSLNLRFGLDDHQFIRFGASRALSRPDFGQLRNYTAIHAPAISTTADSSYVIWTDPNGPHTAANVKGYNFVFTADSGYGGLSPITADQFDLSYENYFSSTSSFTIDMFYKKLNGSIEFGNFLRSFTNNGATENVRIRGPQNGDGGGTLKGFEVAYQSFFDFLPSPFDGLGLQANYTHTSQSGINNSNLANQPGYAAGGTIAFGGGLETDGAVIDSHRLAGISDDSYNLVVLYEKGKIGARLAYSWRSAFLANNLDCCIGLPIWQKASGFLDGSFRYALSDNVELSLDASNMLGTTTVMQQQVFGDSKQTPGAAAVTIDSDWIKSDRRYQIGVRFKY